MDETTTQMHLAAGEHYGREVTCGTKHDYKTEAKADMAAKAVSLKRVDGKVLEAYPCFWCGGWHIGRAMTPEEQARFTPGGVTGQADGDCKSSVSGSTPDIASTPDVLHFGGRLFRRPGRGAAETESPIEVSPGAFMSFSDGSDDESIPYCLDCDRYLCRRKPGMENHRIVHHGDSGYPSKPA